MIARTAQPSRTAYRTIITSSYTLVQDASRFDAMDCSDWAALGDAAIDDAFGTDGAFPPHSCGVSPARQALSHDSATCAGGGGATAAAAVSSAAGQDTMSHWGVSSPGDGSPGAGTPERSPAHSDGESAHAVSMPVMGSRPSSSPVAGISGGGGGAAGKGAPHVSQEHSSGTRISPSRSDGDVTGYRAQGSGAPNPCGRPISPAGSDGESQPQSQALPPAVALQRAQTPPPQPFTAAAAALASYRMVPVNGSSSAAAVSQGAHAPPAISAPQDGLTTAVPTPTPSTSGSGVSAAAAAAAAPRQRKRAHSDETERRCRDLQIANTHLTGQLPGSGPFNPII